MDIWKKLKELNFPIGEYLVVGGAMAAHGIREAHDLDILVTPKLYRQLKKDEWKICDCEQCRKTNRFMLKGDGVDILPNYTYGNYDGDVHWLMANADIINGYPFINLSEYIKFKKELNRPKDIVDIELIRKYLDQQQKT